MAKHEDWIKYAVYAGIGYFAYKNLVPKLTSVVNTVHLPTLVNNLSTSGWSNVQTIDNPSGIPASSLTSDSTPISTAALSIPITTKVANSLQQYYISAIDKGNIILAATNYSNPNNPQVASLMKFSDWAKFYQIAKGMVLPAQPSDVGLDSNSMITIDQFILSVNARFANPTIQGLGYFGLQQSNGWYGVL